MSGKYLKKGNIPTITLYLIWNVALFLVLSNETSGSWDSIKGHMEKLKAKDSLLSLLMPLVLTVTSGFLPASWKAILVFWKIKNPLPGSRVFTSLSKYDPRIDQSLLTTLIGKVPATPQDENALWYRWYKEVQDKLIVQESHKQFLLNRDLAAISFLFLVFGSLAVFPPASQSVTAASMPSSRHCSI